MICFCTFRTHKNHKFLSKFAKNHKANYNLQSIHRRHLTLPKVSSSEKALIYSETYIYYTRNMSFWQYPFDKLGFIQEIDFSKYCSSFSILLWQKFETQVFWQPNLVKEHRVACDSFALERCCLQLTSSPRDAHPRGAFFTL